MKTYEILKILTDEEVERMLSREYTINGQSLTAPCERSTYYQTTCPMGVALEPLLDWVDGHFYDGAPTESYLTDILLDRTDATRLHLHALIADFTGDADRGKIAPEDLPQIVAASRLLDSEST